MQPQPFKPFREERPWGDFVKFIENTPCTVKIITVKKGEAFSLQYHNSREEHWYIISGDGIATIGQEKLNISAKKEFLIPAKTLHRIEAEKEDVVFLEVSTGNFDEKDIVRTEDKYSRV